MHASAEKHFHDWDAPEFGKPKALLAALFLMVLFGAVVVLLLNHKTKPPLQAIQITQATLTSLPQPKPPPPPPPKVVPPPKPVPPVIHKPPPVPSKIVVATKPPPPVHHVMKPPPPRPVPHHVEAPPKPTPPQPAPVHVAPPAPRPAPPAAAPTSGIGPYGAEMHAIIQSNQSVPPGIAQMGLSGTALVKIEVSPSGQVIGASIVRSSGNPLIDQTALQHARGAHFPAFNNQMPGTALTFEVPVEISPGDGGDDSD